MLSHTCTSVEFITVKCFQCERVFGIFEPPNHNDSFNKFPLLPMKNRQVVLWLLGVSLFSLSLTAVYLTLNQSNEHNAIEHSTVLLEYSTAECVPADAVPSGQARKVLILTAFSDRKPGNPLERNESVPQLREAYKNRVVYGNKFNYDVIFDFHEYSKELNTNGYWNKVASLKKYITKYDWVLWMDVDCFFKDFNRSLDKLLDKAERHDIHLMLPNDFEGTFFTFSNFVFLIRGSYWGRRFVDIWYDNGIFGNCKWPDPSTGKAEGWMDGDQTHMWIALVNVTTEYSGMDAECLKKCGSVHPGGCANDFFNSWKWTGTDVSKEKWTVRPPALWTQMAASRNVTGLAVQAAWGNFAEARNMYENALMFHCKVKHTYFKWYLDEYSAYIEQEFALINNANSSLAF
jgi:hypothetical protein